MISTLDHLIIAVKDLDQAEKNYKKILGTNPVWRGRHKSLGTANSIFNFKNTYLELLTSDGEGLGAELVKNLIQENGEGLAGIVFGVDDMLQTVQQLKQEGYQISDPAEGEGSDDETNKVRKWENLFLPPELTRGLFSFIIQHHDGELPSHKEYAKDSINKLDHVVINTNNADSFIETYRDVFKIRLALDKTIEHWNSRMLFFRLNKTTIEVVERPNNEKPKDTLWGLAWEVETIEDTHKRLVSEGVEVSDIKAGLKENTLVATVKSHTHNVPTLIIQHL
jgi:catechol 2,3-dioxygenase-like lactoylglutathione lyase family enzyme